MTTLIELIAVLQTHLVAAGLHAATINLFSQDAEPASELHNSYSFLSVGGDITDAQNSAGFTSDGAEYTVRIVRSWSGSENASATYDEAFKDMLRLQHDIESRTWGTGISSGPYNIDNYQGRADWLQLDYTFYVNAFTPRT